ncbi:hypothetical protein DQ238_00660 [Geodermatophilus sp. TF02-6]|uniref:FAD-dependent monooxygenase n=1 Tax=Geodermatophilus sp. TF02-6 TaxID=2250575 RepID=UPI000DE97E25|nr:hypothetical protein DQ238_00660 [Geodermatophilus sp. TF02-6]
MLQNSPLRALDSLGLVEACAERGHVHRGIDVCDARGAVRCVSAPPSLVEGGPAMVAISRADLADVLLVAARGCGAQPRLGTTVTALADAGDGVEVELSDGGTDECDVVVGADGLHSRTRALVLPQAPRPQRTGQLIWRAAAPRPPQVDRCTMLDDGPAGTPSTRPPRTSPTGSAWRSRTPSSWPACWPGTTCRRCWPASASGGSTGAGWWSRRRRSWSSGSSTRRPIPRCPGSSPAARWARWPRRADHQSMTCSRSNQTAPGHRRPLRSPTGSSASIPGFRTRSSGSARTVRRSGVAHQMATTRTRSSSPVKSSPLRV